MLIIKKNDENNRLKYSNDQRDNDINSNNDNNDYDDDFLWNDIVRYTIGGWIMDA